MKCQATEEGQSQAVVAPATQRSRTSTSRQARITNTNRRAVTETEGIADRRRGWVELESREPALLIQKRGIHLF